MDNQWKGWGLILASSASMAVTFIASKQAMQGMSPLAFSPLWFLAASGWGLLLYLWQYGLRWPISLHAVIKPLLLLGSLNGLANLLLFAAINMGDPTLVAFFSRSVTVYSVLLAAMVLNERFLPHQWLGAVIAIIGAGLMTIKAAPVVWWVLGIMLVSNLFLASSRLLAKIYIQAVPPVVLSTVRTLVMALMLGLISLMAGELALPPNWSNWGWIIGGAFFGPFFSYILFYAGLRHVPLSTAEVIRVTQPLFVALYGLILFGTIMTGQQFLGGSVIIVGIAMLLWQRN
ncbi:DMT family transporter [Anaerolineales bacterium HSG6]|nr:DMT family transporter [Anaerolineales bacterium HSG6]